MPYQYNPQGALNGLFAPAYIPGNQQANAAATAWNAARQARLRPSVPAGVSQFGSPVTGPGYAPGVSVGVSPPAAGGGAGAGVSPPGFAGIGMSPPVFGGGIGAGGGGSFTFRDPTLPSVQQPGQAPVNRNTIAQTLMTQPQRGIGYGV